ncbi:MAG: ribosome small subunit-dependent GTPase A [Bacteroidota bacterium]
MRGLVLKSTGKIYTVELENGTIAHCFLRGKIRMEGLKTTNPVSVGDHVMVDNEEASDRFSITEIEKRTNYIFRKSTNLSKQMQILASNIDRLYIIATLKSPEIQLSFIDRFLVAAESFRIPASIIFNKIDLLNESDLVRLQEISALYEKIGYPCLSISLEEDPAIEALQKEIDGKQVMIGGHSGVGKTTLVNTLDDSLDLRIGEISQAHLQGQHTTTFAEMHRLRSGGYIIDTPGIRAFGITDLDRDVISHYFPEMRDLIGQCKYHNCKHLNEPKCVVKEAVENGAIAASRYMTYYQLMTEDQSEIHRKNKYD